MTDTNLKKTYWYKVNKLFEKLGRKTFDQKIKIILYTVILLSFLIGNIIFIFAEVKKTTRDIELVLSRYVKEKHSYLNKTVSDIENKAKLAIFSYIKGENKNLKYFSVLNIDSVYIKDTNIFLIKSLPIDPQQLDKKYKIFLIKGDKKYIVINILNRGKYFVFVDYNKFLKLAGLETTYLPSLHIPVKFFLTEKSNVNPEKNICKVERLENSNLFIIGCVNRANILKAITVITLLKATFILLILTLLVGLIYNTLFKNIVTFPITYLKNKIEKMNKAGLENVEFNLHKYTSDEFGEISKTLEEARNKLLSEKEKLEIVKKTTEEMSSLSTDLHKFAIYVANNVDKLLNAEGTVIQLVQKSNDAVELSAHSDKFLEKNIPESSVQKVRHELLEIGERNAEKIFNGELRSIYGIKKEVNDDYYLFTITFFDGNVIPKSDDINYVHTILNHLIYNINLLSLATYDPLTKLFNRRFIVSFAENEVKEAIRYKKDLSIIILDIDNFKSVNDTYGHPVGDEVIKKVASVLKTTIRETDKAGRYGGEEFIVILPNTPSKEALGVAERIRKSIEKEVVPVNHNGNHIDLKITVSVGVASLGTHGNTFYDLLQAADLALYEAKRNGKNQVRILSQEEIEKIVKEEFEDERLLEKALDEDKIIPYFQPILDVNTLEVIGYEVLARMENDTEIKAANKFISPSLKLGIAEKIDEIVQRKAIEIMAKKGLKDKYLFFNLSKEYIQNPAKIFKFEEFLFKNRFPSDRIVFEITEEEAINEINIVKEVIRIAKEKNIKFALDDFGTGYSNFIYLRYFDVEILKLDGSLIKNIDKDIDNQIIIEGIAHICRKKGIRLLAEMVETKEELETLKDIGVDYVQGYYFGRPSSEPMLKAKGNVLYRVKKI